LYNASETDSQNPLQNLFEEGQYAFFPSYDVTRLLIECGAPVNALNSSASSPLHTAAMRNNYRKEVGPTLQGCQMVYLHTKKPWYISIPKSTSCQLEYYVLF
jgi:ankyrin repeat protein